jgi:hypothetical protein
MPPTPDLQEHLYRTAGETGWFPPTQEIIEDARRRLGEALVLAARMKQNPNKNWLTLYEGELEIVEHAKNCLKKHQGVLPKLTDDGEDVIAWPEAAKKVLGPSYEPKKRIKGVFIAIPKRSNKPTPSTEKKSEHGRVVVLAD